MRIGINARYTQNTLTGIETALLNLLLNLKKVDLKNEYLLFFGRHKNAPGFALELGYKYDLSKIPTGNRGMKILWSHFYLPYAISRNRVDLFHEPSFVSPVFKTCPTVVTVYDTAFLYLRSSYDKRTRLYFKAFLSGSLKRSDAIIAISENTKKDILDNFKISPDKIHVIHLGRDDIYRVLEDRERIEKVKARYNIRNEFILNVSLISPRKNITGLIKAYKMLKESNRIDASLVIVGKNGWLYEEVYKEVRSSGLDKDVVFTGYIPKEDLLCLYNAAKAFVFPSFYEGFGLPILEAMSCGCPVVASNLSSVPEVCGDAALLTDPYNIEELADAMGRMAADAGLRGEFVKKGLERVKEFSWEKTAIQTLSVYEKTYAYSSKKHCGH